MSRRQGCSTCKCTRDLLQGTSLWEQPPALIGVRAPEPCSGRAVSPSYSNERPGSCAFGPEINLVGINLRADQVGDGGSAWAVGQRCGEGNRCWRSSPVLSGALWNAGSW
jgi:hypothetical protein